MNACTSALSSRLVNDAAGTQFCDADRLLCGSINAYVIGSVRLPADESMWVGRPRTMVQNLARRMSAPGSKVADAMTLSRCIKGWLGSVASVAMGSDFDWRFVDAVVGSSIPRPLYPLFSVFAE